MPVAAVLASLLWLPGPAPFASGARAAARLLLGPPAYLVPICLAVTGIEALREGGRPLRVLVGLLALVGCLSVLWALGEDNPGPAQWGLLGATVSKALSGALGLPAAYLTVVFGALAAGSMGLKIPVWRAVAAGVSWVERKLTAWSARRRELRADRGAGAGSAAEPTQETEGAGVVPEPTVNSETEKLDSSVAAEEPSLPRSRRPATAARTQRGGTGQLSLRLATGGAAFPATAYPLPPIGLLRGGFAGKPVRGSLEEVGRVLVDTLHQFDVEATLSGITPGPTVTRFEVELAPGVKVAKVKGLSDDIAYALAAESVRIQAPIPGKSAIGIEIPNRERRLVTVGDVLGSAAGRAASHPLDCALGKDISGKPVLINLVEMPHLLIAGTTGGGKSSTINALVTSLIMRNGPEQVRLLLVDPKRVELGIYDGIPHLLTHVVTNPKRASEALGWVVREMELRYEKLAELGARDISSYNSTVSAQGGALEGDNFRHTVMGYIVVVVDELNDLMMVAARDVEDSIMRLAQMARAVGIHLVIATQRPSTNVITGVIKANIPSRIAFKVGSQVDSRVILDTGGAEDLVGMGDMLLLTASSGVPRRIQGCFVTEEEVRKIVAHWIRLVPTPEYLDDAIFTAPEGEGPTQDDDDDLLEQAMDLVVETQLGSTSMLQRKLRVGFARAGRLMDLLERRGVVGPSEGSKARAVLVSPEEYREFKARRSVDHRNDQY